MKAKAASQHQYIVIQDNQSQINEDPFLYISWHDQLRRFISYPPIVQGKFFNQSLPNIVYTIYTWEPGSMETSAQILTVLAGYVAQGQADCNKLFGYEHRGPSLAAFTLL